MLEAPSTTRRSNNWRARKCGSASASAVLCTIEQQTSRVANAVFQCADGEYVYVTTFGAPVYKALIEFLEYTVLQVGYYD